MTGNRREPVVAGDSLYKIAERVYGDGQGHRWREIYEANKDLIRNPDIIQVGWELTVPNVQEIESERDPQDTEASTIIGEADRVVEEIGDAPGSSSGHRLPQNPTVQDRAEHIAYRTAQIRNSLITRWSQLSPEMQGRIEGIIAPTRENMERFPEAFADVREQVEEDLLFIEAFISDDRQLQQNRAAEGMTIPEETSTLPKPQTEQTEQTTSNEDAHPPSEAVTKAAKLLLAFQQGDQSVVRELQHQLNQTGLDVPALVVDGIHGPKTAGAIEAFTSQYSQEITAVRQAIEASRATVSETLQAGNFAPDQQEGNEELETHLQRIGVDIGTVDGVLDQSFYSGILRYMEEQSPQALENLRTNLRARQQELYALEQPKEAQMREIQGNLLLLGHDVQVTGAIDENGRIDSATAEAIMLDQTLHAPAEPADVRAYQQALTKAGFNPRGIDGIWGPNTRRASHEARDLFTQYGIEPPDRNGAGITSHHISVLQAHERERSGALTVPRGFPVRGGLFHYDPEARRRWQERVDEAQREHVPISSPIAGSYIKISDGFKGTTSKMAPEHRGHPTSGRNHDGVDFAPEVAGTNPDLLAAAGGVVLSIGHTDDYGNYITIGMDDGRAYMLTKASSINANVGDTVERGQVLGVVGATGISTGPHVHLEVANQDNEVVPAALPMADGSYVELTSTNLGRVRSDLSGKVLIASGRRDFSVNFTIRRGNELDEEAEAERAAELAAEQAENGRAWSEVRQEAAPETAEHQQVDIEEPQVTALPGSERSSVRGMV